jgi:hypothetical protein
MKGEAFYNAHAHRRHTAVSMALPLLARGCEIVPLPEPGADFTIVDYGSASGHGSLEPIRAVVRAVSQRISDTTPIVVYHNDLPSNDFGALFARLEGDQGSYLRGAPNVFACGIGRSFYQQVVPTGRVHLGWTSNAVQWLSAVPAPVRDHVFFYRRRSEPLAERFADQARRDWQTFLEHRARELRPGGCLVAVFASADDEGFCGAERLLDLANRVLQGMVEERLVRRVEYERMTVGTYYRTLEEVNEPLVRGPVSEALRVEYRVQVVAPDRRWDAYESSGDLEAFAAACTDWLRALSEPSLFGAGVLDPDRAPEVRYRLADEFYARVRRGISTDPSAARCQWRMALLLVARR